MYHLTQTSDRRLAVHEAVRVLRPGGVIAVIAINRAANLLGATLANTLQHRKAQLLEASGNLQRMLATIPLTDDERAAVDDGHIAVSALLDRLADVPTPVGPTPREIGTPATVTMLPIVQVRHHEP
jgi:hypothetical protein